MNSLGSAKNLKANLEFLINQYGSTYENLMYKVTYDANILLLWVPDSLMF